MPRASDIARFLVEDAKLAYESVMRCSASDIEISRPMDLMSDRKAGGLFWSKAPKGPITGAALIAPSLKNPPANQVNEPWVLIGSSRPRLAMAVACRRFFAPRPDGAGSVRLGRNVTVGEGSVLGRDGQGEVWWEEQRSFVHFPHYGLLVIGDDVTIGPLCAIQRGVFTNTVIGNGCRIAAGVNVGHGTEIGVATLISAQASIGGSCRIGDKVVIWQGALISNGVSIGAGAVIGMGAIVRHNVAPGECVVGNPAHRIERAKETE